MIRALLKCVQWQSYNNTHTHMQGKMNATAVASIRNHFNSIRVIIYWKLHYAGKYIHALIWLYTHTLYAISFCDVHLTAILIVFRSMKWNWALVAAMFFSENGFLEMPSTPAILDGHFNLDIINQYTEIAMKLLTNSLYDSTFSFTFSSTYKYLKRVVCFWNSSISSRYS